MAVDEIPPTLSYADDAKQQGELRGIALLQRLLIFSTIAYYAVYTVYLLFVSNAFLLPARLLVAGVLLTMVTFVGILATRLHNILFGVVMAFLVIIPCAGYFIPIMLILNANDPLTKAGYKPGFFGARPPG